MVAEEEPGGPEGGARAEGAVLPRVGAERMAEPQRVALAGGVRSC
jgi:hypothetical protein